MSRQVIHTIETDVDPNDLTGLFGDDELASAFGESSPSEPAESATQKKPSINYSILPDDDPHRFDGFIAYLMTLGDYTVHKFHDLGHHIYPRGCWMIKYRKDLVRFADIDQMLEMTQMLERGFMAEVIEAVQGTGAAGPVRVGKPQIDAKGNIIVETNNGNHGPLPDECKWIEEHDPVFIQYAGSDENWPNGCWCIEGNAEPQYVDDEQLKFIAHETLGMPYTMPQTMKHIRSEYSDWADKADSDPLADLAAAFDAFDDPDPIEFLGEEITRQTAIGYEPFDDKRRALVDEDLGLAFAEEDDLASAFG